MTLTEAIKNTDRDSLERIVLALKDEYPQVKFQLIGMYREALQEKEYKTQKAEGTDEQTKD